MNEHYDYDFSRIQHLETVAKDCSVKVQRRAAKYDEIEREVRSLKNQISRLSSEDDRGNRIPSPIFPNNIPHSQIQRFKTEDLDFIAKEARRGPSQEDQIRQIEEKITELESEQDRLSSELQLANQEYAETSALLQRCKEFVATEKRRYLGDQSLQEGGSTHG